jgi:uncharacterized repeat protein (TIGR01451 family)
MNKRKRFTGPAIVLILLGMFAVSALPKAVGSMSTNAGAQSVNSIGQVSSEDEGRRSAVRDATTQLVEMGARYQSASEADRPFMIEELSNLASTRWQLLEQLMESDPAEVLRLALPEEIRAGLPPHIQGGLEQRVDIEGELEVLYEDWSDGSRLRYSLDSGVERLRLHFTSDPQTNLLTGSRVRVRGVRVDDAVVLDGSSESFASSGYEVMSAPSYPNTVGEQRLLVVLVNFQDKQTQPFTADQVRNMVFGTVNNFYKEVSYQEAWLTGDIFGWYTLPLSSTTCDTLAIATYARQAVVDAGGDPTAYNRHVFIFPAISSCGFSGSATVGGNPSRANINGSLSLRVIGHELGHNFGLYHAHALDCGSQVIGDNCTTLDYGDTIDIMGQPTGQFHAYHKDELGWLDNGTSPPVTTVQSSGTYWIDPLESPGSNPKALRVVKSVSPTTGRITWYYIEFRRPIGSDSFISSNNNLMNGVVIHQGVQGVGTGNWLLDMTPDTSSWSDPALVVGRSYNDPNAGVTITPVSVSSTGASVNVSFGALSCVRVNPSVAASPSQSQWVDAGGTATWTITVTNNDNGGCTASNFNLQATLPAGWTTGFDSSTLTVSPGGGATTNLQVTAPPLAADGFYNVGVAVTNSSELTSSGSMSLTCVVASSFGVTASSSQSSYTRNQTAKVAASVSYAGSPVIGASVVFTLTKSDGSVVTGAATTGTTGSAGYSYRFNKKKDPVGTYKVNAVASMNGITGSAATTFMVK